MQMPKYSSTFPPRQSILLTRSAVRPTQTDALMPLQALEQLSYGDEGHGHLGGADTALERDADE